MRSVFIMPRSSNTSTNSKLKNCTNFYSKYNTKVAYKMIQKRDTRITALLHVTCKLLFPAKN